MTVLETPAFLAAAKDLISDETRAGIVEMLGRDPLCGEVIPDSGGVRKVRVALEGRGKRSGGRVIYYFHSTLYPLVIFTMYAKNAKSDLTPSQRRKLAAVVAEIKQEIHREK